MTSADPASFVSLGRGYDRWVTLGVVKVKEVRGTWMGGIVRSGMSWQLTNARDGRRLGCGIQILRYTRSFGHG
jgi:hypothetical protein